jgi:mannitol/fructose-specific phosphotransferase system IIA component
MKAVAGTNDQETATVLGQLIAHPSGVSETSRAILLGIGIMAVAYTYRCAWLNHRPD